jgi:hypothetical protein
MRISSSTRRLFGFAGGAGTRSGLGIGSEFERRLWLAPPLEGPVPEISTLFSSPSDYPSDLGKMLCAVLRFRFGRHPYNYQE